jgi:transketolase C-terminal domain/subunit
MTMRALEAAKAAWQKDRVDVGVLHVPTIKPLDVETISGKLQSPAVWLLWLKTIPSLAAWAKRSPGC